MAGAKRAARWLVVLALVAGLEVAVFVLVLGAGRGGAHDAGLVPTTRAAVRPGPTTSTPGGRAAPVVVPARPGRTRVLVHEAPPVVGVPATPCRDAWLRARVTAVGPYVGMGLDQEVVSVTSSTPCRVDGYPVLRFDPDPVPVADGGTVGRAGPPGPVALGVDTVPASFLLQAGDRSCRPTSSLFVGAPGRTATVRVSIDRRAGVSGFAVCEATRVSPFEQGDSVDDYV